MLPFPHPLHLPLLSDPLQSLMRFTFETVWRLKDEGPEGDPSAYKNAQRRDDPYL